MPVENVVKLLKQNLPPALFLHSSGVAKTASELAVRLGCNESQAELAGWLHDCARGIPAQDLLMLAEAHDVDVDQYSLRHPALLHAPIGAVIARRWGFTDETMLEAISYHTLGKPGLSLLGQIIYVADKIEPGRDYPGVNELRQIVHKDFNAGLMQAVALTINHVLQKKQVVHPLTVSFWNWLIEIPG